MPDPSDTPLSLALRQAFRGLGTVLDDWNADPIESVALRRAATALRRDACLAIVLFEHPERAGDTVLGASRAAAIASALRVNACLASAYQDRSARPRTILAACHAVARLIEQLNAATGSAAAVWWN